MQRLLVIPFQGKVVGRCGCACLRLLLAKDGAKRTRAKRGREISCSFARRHPPRLRATPFLRKGVRRCSARLSSPFKERWWGDAGCACLRLSRERSGDAEAACLPPSKGRGIEGDGFCALRRRRSVSKTSDQNARMPATPCAPAA